MSFYDMYPDAYRPSYWDEASLPHVPANEQERLVLRATHEEAKAKGWYLSDEDFIDATNVRVAERAAEAVPQVGSVALMHSSEE
jgi:hypothetical protein